MNLTVVWMDGTDRTFADVTYLHITNNKVLSFQEGDVNHNIPICNIKRWYTKT